MNLWQNYLLPRTLEQAMQALASAPRPLAPIAGGTDLLLDLEQGRHSAVQTLVDITEVEELLALEVRGDQLFVGAGVPVSRVVSNQLARRHALALVEACELIGGPQVRNVATLGGNVAHALPAADGTIALLALDAQAEVADLSGSRRVPFSTLFLGPGKSALKHEEELLVGFYVPLQKEGQANSFKRIMRPQGVALPIINVAVWLERERDRISDIRIAVGPGGGIPWHATDAEKLLVGKIMDAEVVNAALEALLGQVVFRSSPRRASADYRRHLVRNLFKEALEVAWQRS